MRTLLGIIIAALFAIILWGSLGDNVADMDTLTDERVLQAYMENFQMLAMDDQGKPALKMHARSMKQYSDNQLAELESPQIELHDADKQWHIASEQGQIDHEQQHVALQNQVILKQLGDNAGSRLEIHTQALKIDIDRQRISTEAPVTIITDHAHLQSTGLLLDNRNGTLQLLAQVEGVVHAP